MTAGWIKLLKDDVVIERFYYAGKKHRDRIIQGWKDDYGKENEELTIHILPNTTNRNVLTTLKQKEYLMIRGGTLKDKAGRKKYNIPEGPVIEDHKKETDRPKPEYSNNERLQQYFEP